MASTFNAKPRADLKIVVVGNSGTGKTSFCTRWVNDTFNEQYKATVMSDFKYKVYSYKGHNYKIQIWDLAGQDKNVYTSKIFTKNAHGSLIFCDATVPETMNKTLDWKKSIDDNAKFVDGDFLPCVLIQNKIDLLNEDELEVQTEIENFSKTNHFLNYFRTSCKTGIGIDETMKFLIETIIDRLEENSKKNNVPFEDKRTSIVKQKPSTSIEDLRPKNKFYCC